MNGEVDWQTLGNILVAHALGEVNACIIALLVSCTINVVLILTSMFLSMYRYGMHIFERHYCISVCRYCMQHI